MKSNEYRDLGKLARKRTREAVMSVGQLFDNDAEKAALLVSVAVDFIKGAAVMLQDDDEGVSDEEAFSTVLEMVFNSLGAEVIVAAEKMEKRR